MILRLKYAKNIQGRFLSHLDLQRTMQRLFRRAGLPLAYSEGFNPHPKISFGSALAVGVTSDGEYLDLELRQPMAAWEALEKMEAATPPGLKILTAQEIKNNRGSLTAQINLAKYRVEASLERPLRQADADSLASLLLGQETIPVIREGKKGPRSIDIREGIYDLSIKADGGTLIIFLDLQIGSAGNVRPEEVVCWLRTEGLRPRGTDIRGNLRIHRIGLFIKDKDGIKTPLDEVL
jgi:radical SAM-linked protein